MPLEVIGAGWGRTGTMSLKDALEELGYPCHHMKEVVRYNRHHMALFIKARKLGGLPDWEEVYGQGHGGTPTAFTAAVDWPTCTYYKQLMAAYPDAKVILTVRDPDKWITSVSSTIWRIYDEIAHNTPWYVKPLDLMGGMMVPFFEAVLWGEEGDAKGLSVDTDPEGVKKLFMEHIEEVKRTVPPERLLVFQVSQGWGPLCAFLGKPVPDKPFPHVNETKDFGMFIKNRRLMVSRLKLVAQLGAAAGVAALAAAAVVALRSRAR